MAPRTFTAAEVIQHLNDSVACAERRVALEILPPEQHKGWTLAIKNLAERFGLAEEYVNNTPLETGE